MVKKEEQSFCIPNLFQIRAHGTFSVGKVQVHTIFFLMKQSHYCMLRRHLVKSYVVFSSCLHPLCTHRSFMNVSGGRADG